MDDEFKSKNNHIEWKKIAGTRDKLIHDYFGIDYVIVWDILQTIILDLDYF
ncbi:HepT-like ribonuclease domain-containing protein [Aquirufa nivalisilvae]